MPVTPEDFQALLQREMARYNPGGDTEGAARDQAVRSANIAAGRGNSTALQRQVAAAASDPAGVAAAVPIPTPRPTIADLFEFPPDLAVSPDRPDNHERSFPAPPVPTQFPPDLAVSPYRPDNGPVMQPPPVDPQLERLRRTRFPLELRHLFQ